MVDDFLEGWSPHDHPDVEALVAEISATLASEEWTGAPMINSADEFDVELGATKLTEDPYLERKVHFQAASCGEIAQVKHVGPAQISRNGGRGLSRCGIVTGHKNRRVVG